MNKRIILLAIIVLVVSCKSGQKKSTENVVADADTVAVVEVPTGPITIHIDDEMHPLYDTLRLGELIESYRLIPLSSSEESFMWPIRDIHFMEDQYFISYGDLITTRMKSFDKNGNFIKEIYNIGRGPNEVISPLERVYNDAQKTIALICTNREILKIDAVTHCLKKIYIDDILKPFRPCSFDNGMYVAMTLKDYKIPESIAKEGSFLYCYDSDFNIIGSIADNKDRTHRNIEGVTTFPRLEEILSQSGDRVLYKDMLNDTIYNVSVDGKLTPAIIVDIPNKLKPTLRESELAKEQDKHKKIYLDNVTETKDYIIITYYFKGVQHTGIWSKATQELLYLSTRLSGVIHLVIQINEMKWHEACCNFSTENNTFITDIPASMAKSEIDSLKDEDNSVLVEITLANGK